jgi:rRNA maturation RNase YbeY
MIEFFSQLTFELSNEQEVSEWLNMTADSLNYEIGDLTYVFCTDEHLHKINLEFLAHDTYTDIITFNYNLHRQVNGEVYISVDRVRENASTYKQRFQDELHRVMVHGLLHLCGLNDKEEEEIIAMRKAEDQALERRDFV